MRYEELVMNCDKLGSRGGELAGRANRLSRAGAIHENHECMNEYAPPDWKWGDRYIKWERRMG